MVKLWFIPVVGKVDEHGNAQRLPKPGHVLAHGTFSFQAVNVSDAAGYIASGQLREAVDSDRDGALAVLDAPPGHE